MNSAKRFWELLGIATLALGVHGRRRSGMGETFWQFRRFRDGDAPNAIDWRKSARSHRLYVRENESEAAGTVWLWFNRSKTMAYRSLLKEYFAAGARWTAAPKPQLLPLRPTVARPR